MASLFRNYLLAERILRANGCQPVSSPALPVLAEHPLWNAWDHSLDVCLSYLRSQNNNGDKTVQQAARDLTLSRTTLKQQRKQLPISLTPGAHPINVWVFCVTSPIMSSIV